MELGSTILKDVTKLHSSDVKVSLQSQGPRDLPQLESRKDMETEIVQRTLQHTLNIYSNAIVSYNTPNTYSNAIKQSKDRPQRPKHPMQHRIRSHTTSACSREVSDTGLPRLTVARAELPSALLAFLLLPRAAAIRRRGLELLDSLHAEPLFAISPRGVLGPR